MSIRNNYFPNTFSEYGKATKKYGISRIIWSIIQMIAMYGLASMYDAMVLIDPTDPEAMIALAETYMAGTMLYILILLIGLILFLVMLIQYLSKLNNLAKSTMDSNLKTVFWIEIVNILLVVIGGFIIGVYATFVKLGLFVVIVFLLEKWVKSIPAQTDKLPLMERTKTLFLLMKIGAIYALFMGIYSTYVEIPGILGAILLYLGQPIWAFGLLKIGDEIVASDLFQSSPSIQIEPTFKI
ncbi:MAG: hypothetical protein ACTSWW_08260 [Promethearchaeota archaeon]